MLKAVTVQAITFSRPLEEFIIIIIIMEHFIWEEDNEGKKQLSNIQTATP